MRVARTTARDEDRARSAVSFRALRRITRFLPLRLEYVRTGGVDRAATPAQESRWRWVQTGKVEEGYAVCKNKKNVTMFIPSPSV